MIATFKETVASLRDPKYGAIIIAKPVKPVLWYWTKYLILISLFFLASTLFVLTRFLPEIPGTIRNYLPEGVLTMTDHRLSTTISQPIRIEDNGFLFLFDLQASSSAIESITDGVLITQDKIISKSSGGQLQSQDYSALPDFSIDKYQIADWFQANRYKLWFIGLFLIIIIGTIIVSFTWVFRVVMFLIWTAVFWAITKYLIRKELVFSRVFNLVVYASVLPLILSLLLVFAPNNFLSLLNVGIFIYFTYSWIKNLPGQTKTQS